MRDKNPLNPEAGYVQLPEDPAEVAAALRAGRLTQRLYPYYRWRYGERGRAFTRSDSAWLAWLAGHAQPRVDEQVLWLWSVLANRGMPGRLLELHLHVLNRQLSRATPHRAQVHARLLAAAQELTARRVAVLPDAAAEETAAALADAVDLPAGRALHGTGRLIADAVADEAAGADNAVTSLTVWLGDVEALRDAPGLLEALPAPHRQALESPAAGDRWSRAVAATVETARAHTLTAIRRG